MWKKLQKSSPLFISCNQNNEYEIYVTDFFFVWITQYSFEDFYSILKKSNPDLGIDKEDMLEIGRGMLESPETLKQVDVKYEESLLLTLVKVFPFGKCRVKLSLEKGSAELFNRHVTQGLLNALIDLRQSEKELSSLLNQKDREVHEYYKVGKLNCVRFNTPIYNEEEHMRKHNIFDTTFGSTEIPANFLSPVVPNGQKTSSRDLFIKQEHSEACSSSTVQIKEPKSIENGFPGPCAADLKNTKLIKHENLKQEPSTENYSQLNIKEEISDSESISPRKKQRYRLNF